MYYAKTTQVPNQLFDQLLPTLSFSELKILLVVLRQTVGWVISPSGQRKSRDWLSSRRMQTLAGLSKRAISMATSSLIQRGLLVVTDRDGKCLESPQDRKGRVRLYYSTTFPQIWTVPSHRSATYAEQVQQPMPATKPSLTKPRNTMTRTKGGYCGHIGKVLHDGIAPTLLMHILREEMEDRRREG